MTPLFVSAFFQNTGMTIVLVGIIFYMISRFQATLFELGALSAVGAFVFTVGAKSSKYFSRRFTPKQLTLFGGGLFALTALCYPLLPSLATVFLIYPIGSFGMALFWPSLENWILRESQEVTLKRNLSLFNLSWSPGQIIAPFLAGFLFERGIFLPIWVGVCFMLPVFFILKAFPMRVPQPFLPKPESRQAPPGRFLIVCWLANFTGWFIAAIFRSLFPKYGLALGLSPSVIGAFLLLIGVGQFLFFFLLDRFEGWDRTPRFLFLWEGIAILALLSIALGYRPFLWVISFFLFGCFTGTAYSASLLVSLRERGPHGGGSSSHEALIGLGLCFGPLIGGGVGHLFGMRAPYFAAIAVLTLVLLIQGWLLRKEAVS